MNKIFILLFMTNISYANDVIFLHGFEDNVSVSGVITGLNSSVLHLKMQAGDNDAIEEVINIDQNGSFVFSQLVQVGIDYTVIITGLPTQPAQQSCQIENSSGIVPIGGVNNITINCNNQQWNWDEMNWSEGGWQ